MEYKITFKLRIDDDEELQPLNSKDIKDFLKGKLDGWKTIADDIEVMEIAE